MKDYKRLTDKDWKDWIKDDFYTSACNLDYKEVDTLICRLAELEDKIENGTLVSIPFIWKNTKVDNTFCVVYESEHGDLQGTMFCSENAKKEAEKYLKELKNEK